MPNLLREVLSGDDFAGRYVTQVPAVVSREHHLLHEAVEYTEIGHHAGYRINRALHGDEAIPFPPLVAFLDRGERIPSRHGCTVGASSPRDIRVQILVFVQPDRVKDSNIFLLGKLGPKHQGQVL